MFSKRVIIAAGGTGGHVLPAQALAKQLSEARSDIDTIFVGKGLSSNPYFDGKGFTYFDIASLTPFSSGILKKFLSICALAKGLWQSLRVLARQKPSLVVGFGSFHSFPLLCAAVLKRIPFVLFESNAAPGKVVRLFAKKALFTGVYIAEARHGLKGKTVEVSIPQAEQGQVLSQELAREQLGLNPHLPTLLVFGGSQGSQKINSTLLEALSLIAKKIPQFQLIHLTGNQEVVDQVKRCCASLSIPCYVKHFEERMDRVLRAADGAICRAGAMTLSELLHYELPALLIPYPFAADQHQLKNALFFEQKVKGGQHLPQNSLTSALLADFSALFLDLHSEKRLAFKRAISRFKEEEQKQELATLINSLLQD